MTVKLKTKIALGVIFLFTLLILVGGTGFFYLNKSTTEQHDMLQDNYETLDYTRGMLQAIDNRANDRAGQNFIGRGFWRHDHAG